MSREEGLIRRLELARIIGADAGLLLKKMFGRSMRELGGLGFTLKPEDGNTPRTVIDTKVGGFIKEWIKKRFPSDTIISEDVKGVTGESGWTWWVDPFDGTSNAEPRLHMSTVGIGVSFEGQMVAGVIVNPFEEQVVSAATGHGAFVASINQPNSEEQRIHVSSGRPFARRFIVVDGLWNKQTAERKAGFLRALGEREIAQNVRMVGSNLLAWSLVAQGRVDAAFMDAVGGHWDTAAGIVLVTEAGGILTDLADFTPEPDGYHAVLAANDGALHDELIAITDEYYAGYTGFRAPKSS